MLLLAVAVVWLCYGRAYDWFKLIPPGQCVVEGVQMSAGAAAESASSQAEGIACDYWPSTGSGDLTLNEIGLTGSAERMLESARVEFGRLSVGGYEPGGVSTGHIKGSAHYEGRAVDFFFRPHEKPKQHRAGWQLANWAVLHADELDIRTVIYRDRIWTRNGSLTGWQPYVHPSGDRKNPILRHLDHVHIDVG